MNVGFCIWETIMIISLVGATILEIKRNYIDFKKEERKDKKMKFVILSEYGTMIVEAENFEDAAYFAEKRWGNDIMAIVKIPEGE